MMGTDRKEKAALRTKCYRFRWEIYHKWKHNLIQGGHPNAIEVENLLIEAVSAYKKSSVVDPKPHQKLNMIKAI